MAYMPKSAKLIESEYMPKSAVLVENSKKIITNENKQPFQEIGKAIIEGLPIISQISGNVVGGIAGSKIGRPYSGAAVGGTIGRSFGEYKKTQYEKNPIKTSFNDILSIAMGIPGIQVIPSEQLNKKDISKISEETQKAAIEESIGAGVSAGVGKTIKPILRVTGGKLHFINKLRGAFLESKSKAGKVFQNQLNVIEQSNPNAKINLYDEILHLKQNMLGTVDGSIASNPNILSTIKSGQKKVGSNLLEEVLSNPTRAENLTLSEARTIRQIIDKSPSIQNQLSKGKWANFEPSHIPLLDFVDDIKSKIATAFPDIKGVNAEYADTIKKYNTIKNYIKEGRLISSIEKSGSGLREPEIWSSYVVPLLKKTNPEILKELTSYIRTNRLLSTTGKTIIGTGALGGLGYIAKNISQR